MKLLLRLSVRQLQVTGEFSHDVRLLPASATEEGNLVRGAAGTGGGQCR